MQYVVITDTKQTLIFSHCISCNFSGKNNYDVGLRVRCRNAL